MPEPGWYQDPSDDDLLRRWDGTAWTGDTRSSERMPPAPSGPPLVALVEPLGTWQRRFSVLAFWLGIPGLALAASTFVPGLLFQLNQAPCPSTGLWVFSDLTNPWDDVVFFGGIVFCLMVVMGVLNIIWERIHFPKAFVIAAAIQFGLWVPIGLAYVGFLVLTFFE